MGDTRRKNKYIKDQEKKNSQPEVQTGSTFVKSEPVDQVAIEVANNQTGNETGNGSVSILEEISREVRKIETKNQNQNLFPNLIDEKNSIFNLVSST